MLIRNPINSFILLALLTFCFPYLRAFSLPENGILGDPFVDCGGNHIEVRFDTRNSFRGIVFVEGHLKDPECRSGPIDENAVKNGTARNAQIRLGFDTCGIKHTKHTHPKGVFLSTRLIVAFHPQHLSKFDRVYDLRCFYMEMEHELEKEFDVLMDPPTMHIKQVPMPICRYEVHNGGPDGPPVFYATIGQMVYHKWSCEADGEQQFCMIVHSCMVDDGNGDRVELIDEQGCARDKYLLQNLDYVSDLMVGKEAHVYKYADRQSMFFDCKITLSVKEPGCEYCPVPHCPDPPRRRKYRHFGRRKLHKRHLFEAVASNFTMNKIEIEAEKRMQDPDIKNFIPNCSFPIEMFSLLSLNVVMVFGTMCILYDGFKQLRH